MMAEKNEDFANFSYLTPIYGAVGLRHCGKSRVLVWSAGKDAQKAKLPTNLLLQSLSVAGIGSVMVTRPVTLQELEVLNAESKRNRSGTEFVFFPHEEDEVGAKDLHDVDLVVFLSHDHEKALEMSKVCHNRIPFVWAVQLGPLVSIFCQPVKTGFNPEGFCRNDNERVFVGHVSKQDDGKFLVTCISPHGLESGDIVSIENQSFCIDISENSSSTEFWAIGNPEEEMVDKLKKSGNPFDNWNTSSSSSEKNSLEVLLKKRNGEPETWNFSCLEESAYSPEFENETEQKWNIQRHVVFLAQCEIGKTVNQICDELLIKDEDKSYIYELNEKVLNLKSQAENLNLGFITGLLTSQILNILTKRFRPIKQWMLLELPFLPPKLVAQMDGKRKLTILLNGGTTGLAVKLFDLLIEKCSDMVERIVIAGGDEPLSKSISVNSPNSSFKLGGLDQSSFMLLKERAIALASPIKIDNMVANISENENEHFTNKFFEEISIMINVGGSTDDRRNISEQSVQHSKPLFDIGIDKFSGHLQSVIPFVTESYNCSNDPSDPEVPYCVLKSFPYSAEHAISWAEMKVENLTRAKPAMFNNFWSEGGSDLPTKIKEGEVFDKSAAVSKFIKNLLCSSYTDCVVMARQKFEKYFNHKPKHLLNHFPSDSQTRDGSRFWTFPKKVPRPVEFNSQNEDHVMFVADLAMAFAILMDIKVSHEEMKGTTITSILSGLPVIPFVPKANKEIVIDENVTKAEVSDSVIDSRELDVNTFVKDLNRLNKTKLEMENLPRDLIHRLLISFTNLRCEMYDIRKPMVSTILGISGHGCPCPEPMINILADLAVQEVRNFHYTYNPEDKEFFKPRDWWLSLAPLVTILSSESKPVSKMEGVSNMTLWDSLVLKAEPSWTLKDFLQNLHEKYKIQATMIVQGTRMVYVKVMPGHSKRMDKLMSSLIKRDPNCDHVTLHITIPGLKENEEEDDVDSSSEVVSAPPVKLYF